MLLWAEAGHLVSNLRHPQQHLYIIYIAASTQRVGPFGSHRVAHRVPHGDSGVCDRGQVPALMDRTKKVLLWVCAAARQAVTALRW